MSFQDQTHMIVIGPNGQKKTIKPSQMRAEFERLQAKKHKAEQKALDAAVKAQAEEGKRIMEERTAAGDDYERKPFGALSDRYAQEKGSSKVDLKKDDEMMNSLSITKIGNATYKLAFANSFRKQVKGLAEGKWPLFGNRTHMTTNPRPKRRAMGTVAEQDVRAVSKKGWREFQRAIRKELKQ